MSIADLAAQAAAQDVIAEQRERIVVLVEQRDKLELFLGEVFDDLISARNAKDAERLQDVIDAIGRRLNRTA
jgi:hypothetical protein